MKRSKLQTGLTLVEMLVSVAIVGIIGSIVLTIFVISLRGANKSSAISQVRQSGEFTINQITRDLRFAQSVAVGNGNTFTSSCVGGTSGIYKILHSTDAYGTQWVYACDVNDSLNHPNIVGISGYYLDTAHVSLVPGSCSFSCYQATASSPPQISLQFTLTQASGLSVVNTPVTIPFQTTITPRNFQP